MKEKKEPQVPVESAEQVPQQSHLLSKVVRISPRTGKPVEPRNYTSKKKVGRPSKYTPQLADQLIKFFATKPYEEIVTPFGITKKAIDFPLLIDFIMKHKLNYVNVHEWIKIHPEFLKAYKMAKDLQQRTMVVNTLHKLYDSKFAYFASKNLFGWRDEVDLNQKFSGTLYVEHANKSIEELKKEAENIAIDIVRERAQTSKN